MRNLVFFPVLFLTISADLPAADLPIREVILYKHGVGFFERAGKLEAGETARIDFKAEDMNDVLKSLTITDRERRENQRRPLRCQRASGGAAEEFPVRGGRRIRRWPRFWIR